MRRKLPLALSGAFGRLAGEAWWMDQTEIVFWCIERLEPGTRADLGVELGLVDGEARISVEVTELLDQPEIRLRSGYLHTARIDEGRSAEVDRLIGRLSAGEAEGDSLTDVSADTTVLPQVVDEGTARRQAGDPPSADDLLPADLASGQTPHAGEDAADEGRSSGEPSVSVDQPGPRPRGRRLVSQALSRARTQGTRTESGGRRPVNVNEPQERASVEQPVSAVVAPGEPVSLLVRLGSDRAIRTWVAVEGDQVRVHVAPLPTFDPGTRFLVVLQLPDATFVQFHARLARQHPGSTELLSDRLSYGTLLPVRQHLAGA